MVTGCPGVAGTGDSTCRHTGDSRENVCVHLISLGSLSPGCWNVKPEREPARGAGICSVAGRALLMSCTNPVWLHPLPASIPGLCALFLPSLVPQGSEAPGVWSSGNCRCCWLQGHCDPQGGVPWAALEFLHKFVLLISQ